MTDIADYWQAYHQALAHGARSVSADALRRAAALVRGTIEQGRWIYACGNGGSAAIANHLPCDFLKGIQTGTAHRPRVMSLAATIETITAIGNDIGYADIFAYQLRTVAAPGDLLIAVSSSGESENILRALDWARGHGVATIALTGFAGGRAAGRADVSLHVEADNYGVVEDLHQSLMHTLAQFIRAAAMPADALASARF